MSNFDTSGLKNYSRDTHGQIFINQQFYNMDFNNTTANLSFQPHAYFPDPLKDSTYKHECKYDHTIYKH